MQSWNGYIQEGSSMKGQSENTDRNEMKFKGLSISSGRISGRACLYSAERHKSVIEYSLISDESIKSELERFDEVRKNCSDELDKIASDVAVSIGNAESEIFQTQKHIMNDPKVIESIKNMVTEQRRNVEWAISDVFSAYEDKFANLDNQYLRERASDIGEIRRRLLNRLGNNKSGFVCEGQSHCNKGDSRIVVAEELTPDMIVNMNLDKVLGFVTEKGGITSHAAIIARSVGFPSVTGIHGIMKYVRCGDQLLIDGDSGDVYLLPDEKTITELSPVENVETGAVCLLSSPEGTQVLANASTLDDVRFASSIGADGIGLFRTEIQFIKSEKLLSEDEQFDFYNKAADAINGKIVTFRMLDVGGDKPLPFLRIKKEANPYLGWRGARFLLGNPDIFDSQLRALGRVALNHKIRILFPMVVDAHQTEELLVRARIAIGSLQGAEENIEYGVMFEVPSAFLQAKKILELVDFGSIGSNDLIQYLFAIDRSNELVSQDYNPEHPVLWDLLSMLADEADRQNKPLSICGEMAGREGMPTRLIQAGITSLSVTSRLIPRVRNEMAKYTGAIK
jgi:phosphotransferase system enzyme I (PtsI)